MQNTENLSRSIKNRPEQHKSAHENPWSATYVRICHALTENVGARA
jgi:hypothetical protein